LLAGDPLTIVPAPVSVQVSIRARHCWRAILHSTLRSGRANPFQSAPAIAGGRSANRGLQEQINTVFQSAPAIAGGRSPWANQNHDAGR